MNRFRALSTVVLIGTAAMLLSACDPVGVTPLPTDSASVDPTPSGSPSAPADDRPPLEELVLTTEGLGELELGIAPPTDDPASNLVTYEANACPGAPDPSLWLANYPDIDLGFGPQAPFAIATDGDALSRIDINSPDIFTDTGIHIGSTLNELLAVYPGGPDAVVNHADVSDVYVILGTNGKLQFEVAVDRVPGYWDASALDTVVYLSAIDFFTEPYGVAASDNVVGVCQAG